VERITVHVSDDTGRIAMYEKRTVGDPEDDDDTTGVLTRYIYSNHLGSAALELDEDAAIISYEEYHPYGTTSYQAMNASIAAVAKRYRYTGKERDEETGLYYHGARYYIPWLARWSAVDPLQNEMPEWSSYNYGFCNPITFNDPTGTVPGEGDDPNWHAPMSAPEGGFSNGVGSSWNPIELPEVTVTAQAKQPGGEMSGELSTNFTWGMDSELVLPSENIPQGYTVYFDTPLTLSEEVSDVNAAATPSSSSNFEEIIKIVLRHEGGWKNEPHKDKGDPTNMGISWPTWQRYARSTAGVSPTVENLKELSVEQATKIYEEAYWKAKGFDKFKDTGLAAQIYDWTITSGGAVKEIQKLLNSEFGQNLKEDGGLGPKTIAAINSVDQNRLYNRIQDVRKAYYTRGRDAGWFSPDYYQGLINRANDFKRR
jgi:RHS repeat-associated protein